MISKYKENFKQNKFLRNVLTLMTGTTIAQIIAFALSPVLSRIYTPEEFGLLALFTSAASLVSIVATGRYEMAVMLPDKDEDAVNVVALSLSITGALSVLSLLVVGLFNEPLAKLLGDPGIAVWLYWLPLYVLLKGIYQTFNYWANRQREFKRLALSRVYLSVARGGVNLGFGWGNFGAFGLIGGEVIGQGVSTLVLLKQMLKDGLSQKIWITKAKMKEVAIRYQDFPKINSLHAFLDVLQWSGVSFLLANFFGTPALGAYSFTLRVLQAPLSLIGSSVAQVFYQRATEVHNKGGDLYGLVRRTMIQLSFVSLPVFVVTVLFSPPLFAWVFGPEWREAGVYAQILSPWIFVKFIVSPVTQVPIIVNKQKTAFYINVFYNLSQLILLYVVAKSVGDIHTNLAVISGYATVFSIGYGWWMLRLAKEESSLR